MIAEELLAKITADIRDIQRKLAQFGVAVDRSAKQATTSLKAVEVQGKAVGVGFGRLIEIVKKLAVGFLGLMVVRKIVTFLSDCVRLAGDAELQMARLSAMVKTVGRHFGLTTLQIENSVRALAKQAEALQAVTGYSDEEIKAAQAMLSTFMLLAPQIEQITPRLLDMAAAVEKSTGTKVDLQTIAIALGKGFTGFTGVLARYGVVLSEEAKRTGDFNLILRDLDRNFKGAAEAMGKTFVGQSRILRAELDDFKQMIGEEFIPTLLELVKASRSVIQTLVDWGKRLGLLRLDIDDLILSLEEKLGIEYETLDLGKKIALLEQERKKRLEERLRTEQKWTAAFPRMQDKIRRLREEEQLLSQELLRLQKLQREEAEKRIDVVERLSAMQRAYNFIERLGIKTDEYYLGLIHRLRTSLRYLRGDRAAYIGTLEKLREIEEEYNSIIEQGTKNIEEQINSLQVLEPRLRETARTIEEIPRPIIPPEKFQIPIDPIVLAFREIESQVESLNRIYANFISLAMIHSNELAETLVDAMFGVEISWKEFFNRMIKDFTKMVTAMIIKAIVLKAVLSALGIPAPLMPRFPPIFGLEKGAILEKPIFVAGEAGPEIVAPLEEFYDRLELLLHRQKTAPVEIRLNMEGFVNLAEPTMREKFVRMVVKPGLEQIARKRI